MSKIYTLSLATTEIEGMKELRNFLAPSLQSSLG